MCFPSIDRGAMEIGKVFQDCRPLKRRATKLAQTDLSNSQSYAVLLYALPTFRVGKKIPHPIIIISMLNPTQSQSDLRQS